MDGLCRMLGAGVDYEAQGECHWLRPITLGVIAAAEQHLLALRRDIIASIEAMLGGQPEFDDLRRSMIAKAKRELRANRTLRNIRQSDLFAWLLGPQGMPFVVVRCLFRDFDYRKPRFRSLTQAAAWLASLTADERADLQRRTELISCLDSIAEADWPASTGAPTSKAIPWRRLYRSFAEGYQWDAATVNELTLYQVRAYTAPEKDLGGTTWMTAKEARPWMENAGRDDGQPAPAPTARDTPARRSFHGFIMAQHQRDLEKKRLAQEQGDAQRRATDGQ